VTARSPRLVSGHWRAKRVAILSLCLVTLVAAIAAVHASQGESSAKRLLDNVMAQTGSYAPAGYYVGPRDARPNIDSPGITLGKDGLPVVYYPDAGYQRNPVTIEQYGLWAYDEYLSKKDAEHRRIVIRVANWLVSNQSNGRWYYHFDYTIHGASLRKPWASAMAQGQAMSLLERAYRISGTRSYLRVAVQALRPLNVDVKDGGLRRCFFGDCARPFFEEYPTRPPTYVLNGFLFTLVGLYDLASIAPKSGARALYLRGRRTLVSALRRYDINGVASYDLTHITGAGRTPAIATQDYQAIHVYLLHALDSLTPSKVMSRYAKRWRSNISRAPA